MEIRFATLEDLNDLVSLLWSKAKEEDGELNEESYAVFKEECYNYLFELIFSNDHHLWVAIDDKEIVAHMSLKILKGFPEPDREPRIIGIITTAYLKKEYRDRNLLESILDAIEQYRVEHELFTIIVAGNIDETGVFERAGYDMQYPLLARTSKR
ncbi:GNAT family N-acetyltransferase [Geomicrobium sp. JCM 19038]|uniref:GNAT family N-acetyltransferase n=1 Tax=Geomicrobium sp. JCM 19038 TaxID=1460635 RepID=UPI00045F4A37|nr:GNAT family N-acetyltransferase [Geomicrobium sp. JCM 19038]GAK07625.1 hypothetical protein JCM19038_1366 [Geomicrobium sp. JCM 19038]